MNIYVGNLSYDMTDSELREAFAAFGEVTSAKVISDRDTGRSKGFGFVEMADSSAAEAAINALNGNDVGGRPLRVSEARPRQGGGGGGGRSFR
jgi:RNA recognition motif-containing protein